MRLALLLPLLLARPSAGEQPCLPRCCPPAHWLNETAGACLPQEASARLGPPLYRLDAQGQLHLLGNATLCEYSDHPCPEASLALESGEEHYLLDTGQLYVPGMELYSPDSFCLAESFTDFQLKTIICIGEGGAEVVVSAGFGSVGVLGVLMLVSSLFVLATFVVYASLKRLRNINGKTLMSQMAALFVAYLTTGLAGIFEIEHDGWCQATAFIIYFSFLASFFWLNVMCFDIFWTFSGFRSLRGTVKEREHKKFIIYSLYSWGCPLVMLCVALVMQFHEDIPEDLLKPNFGGVKCWFPDKMTTLAYFFGPVGVLVLCNIILFILTAIKIAKLKRETAMLRGAESRRHDEENRQRFNLYLKLFLVMGVNWSMELISWLAGGPLYVWYVTDICNTLQGVLIFVIFVWKDRIRRMLMERFCPKRAAKTVNKSTAVTYSTRTSPSRLSHGMHINKGNDNSNGEAIKMTTLSHVSEDSDVA